MISLFFFNDPATTEIYTLSLHDALPICVRGVRGNMVGMGLRFNVRRGFISPLRLHRSEEHTSELQSRRDLVCRLLLEKKKNTTTTTKDQPSFSEILDRRLTTARIHISPA